MFGVLCSDGQAGKVDMLTSVRCGIMTKCYGCRGGGRGRIVGVVSEGELGHTWMRIGSGGGGATPSERSEVGVCNDDPRVLEIFWPGKRSHLTGVGAEEEPHLPSGARLVCATTTQEFLRFLAR